MKFEWDEKKNAVNKKKHQLYLDQALDVFYDPYAQEYYDDEHSTADEDRYILVGYAEDRPLVVIFTEPEPDTKRIISVRVAEKYELEELYYGYS